MISMIVSQSSDNHTETKYTHHCDTTIKPIHSKKEISKKIKFSDILGVKYLAS